MSDQSSSLQPQYSFLFRVWELLSTSAKASHYFFTPSEMNISNWQLRKETWWGRVSPLVEGKVEWPSVRVGSTQEWDRLILPESGDLTEAIKRMNTAFSTHKSRKKAKGQRRSYVWHSEPDEGSSQRSKKRKAMNGSEDVISIEHSAAAITGPSSNRPDHSPPADRSKKKNRQTPKSSEVLVIGLAAGYTPNMGETPDSSSVAAAASSSTNPVCEPPMVPPNDSIDLSTFHQDNDPVLQSQSTLCPVFNLIPDQANSMPGNTHAPIIWTGTNGIEVHTEFPYHPMLVPEGNHYTNALWKAAEVLSALAEIGLTENTTPELMVIDEAQYNRSWSEVLVAKVNGLMGCHPPIWNLSGCKKIESARFLVDYVRREVNALRGGADTSPKDALYERVIPPIPSQPRTYLPAGNGEKEVELMNYGAFLDRVNNGRALFILDFPITHRKGMTYSALDHTDECLNNTKWLGDVEMWRDLTWGLSHAGQVVTWFHHDGDGKMTVIQALTGAKIWTLFIPDSSLSAEKVQDLHLWMAERKDKLPGPSLGKLVNVLLLPGDTLFMPPGMMHLVYTPIPSIFRGSSFWNFHSLHLTAFSLRGDSLAADVLTNIDHCYRMVFQTILRLVLALPVMSNYVPRRAVVYNLYDLLQNPQDYIFVAQKDDDYPQESHIEAARQKKLKGKKKSKGKKTLPISRNSMLESMITSVKTSRSRVLKSTRHFRRAAQILEALIECDGRIVPPVNEAKRLSSKAWIAELENCSQWSDPGPVIQVDRSVLLAVLKDDAHDLSDLSDLSDVE
ncbi:hypothetical protein V5O48_004030 [Marasmius crinis-equi]|uniref:JmjC domain-containing protein n=1 Tax=Marasmius crinis-equi TaxID=585013 RepID=A0ABR3FR79_9AGAR